MEDWRKRVPESDQKLLAALSHIANVIGVLSEVAEERNELEGRLRDIDGDTSRQLKSPIMLFVEQFRLLVMLPGMIGQSVSVFSDLVNTFGRYNMN